MRLSEAIMLGDSLKRATNTVWLSHDGSCGCAFGGALLAAGVNVAAFTSELRARVLDSQVSEAAIPEIAAVRELWPWLQNKHLNKITELYGDVIFKLSTIESVVDWVRSVEPEEVEAVRAPIEAETVTEGRDLESVQSGRKL